MRSTPKYIRVRGHLYIRAEEKKTEVEFVKGTMFDSFDRTGKPAKGSRYLYKVKGADEYYIVSYSPTAQETAVFRGDKNGEPDTSQVLGVSYGKGTRKNVMEAMESAGLQMPTSKVYRDRDQDSPM